MEHVTDLTVAHGAQYSGTEELWSVDGPELNVLEVGSEVTLYLVERKERITITEPIQIRSHDCRPLGKVQVQNAAGGGELRAFSSSQVALGKADAATQAASFSDHQRYHVDNTAWLEGRHNITVNPTAGTNGSNTFTETGDGAFNSRHHQLKIAAGNVVSNVNVRFPRFITDPQTLLEPAPAGVVKSARGWGDAQMRVAGALVAMNHAGLNPLTNKATVRFTIGFSASGTLAVIPWGIMFMAVGGLANWQALITGVSLSDTSKTIAQMQIVRIDTGVPVVLRRIHDFKLRVRNAGVLPVVEWAMDGVVVATHTGYLSSSMLQPDGAFLCPQICIYRGADAANQSITAAAGFGPGLRADYAEAA